MFTLRKLAVVLFVFVTQGPSFLACGFSTNDVGFVSRRSHQRCREATTLLYGCRSGKRRHRQSFGEPRENKWIGKLETMVSGDILTGIREAMAYQERRRQRKALKILYALGFLFTFPVGPLLFLGIRHRDTILDDLRLSSASTSTTAPIRKDSSPTTLKGEKIFQSMEKLNRVSVK